MPKSDKHITIRALYRACTELWRFNGRAKAKLSQLLDGVNPHCANELRFNLYLGTEQTSCIV